MKEQKWNSENLEDATVSQKFKQGMIRRLVRQAESPQIYSRNGVIQKRVFLRKHNGY
jgi:hypothetical protein